MHHLVYTDQNLHGDQIRSGTLHGPIIFGTLPTIAHSDWVTTTTYGMVTELGEEHV